MRPSELFEQGIDVTKMGLESTEVLTYEHYREEVLNEVNVEITLREKNRDFVELGPLSTLKHELQPDWYPDNLSTIVIETSSRLLISTNIIYARLKQARYSEWAPNITDQVLSSLVTDLKPHNLEAFADHVRLIRNVRPSWMLPPLTAKAFEEQLEQAKETKNYDNYAILARLKHEVHPDWQSDIPDDFVEVERQNFGYYENSAVQYKHELDPNWRPEHLLEDIRQHAEKNEWLAFVSEAKTQRIVDPTWLPDMAQIDTALAAVDRQASYQELTAYTDLVRFKLELLQQRLHIEEPTTPSLPEVKNF